MEYPSDIDHFLRAVAVFAAGQEPSSWPAPRPHGVVAEQLVSAASALRAAGDVLASHINPTALVRSRQGVHLRSPGSKAGVIGDLALVAETACATDQELRRWLERGMRRSPELKALHEGEIRRIGGPLGEEIRRQFEGHRYASPEVIRQLQVASAVAPAMWRVARNRDVIGVVRAVAADLYRNPEQATILSISDACRLGIRAAERAAHLGGWRAGKSRVRSHPVVALWRTAGFLVDEYGPQPKVEYPMRATIAETVAYLTLPPPRDSSNLPGKQHHFKDALADLAGGTLQALEHALMKRQLVTETYVLGASHTGLIRRAEKQWEVMTSADERIANLTDILSDLATRRPAPLNAAPDVAAQLDAAAPGPASAPADQLHRPPDLTTWPVPHRGR
ncbi:MULTISPECIES: hypothetical protein [Catenuloplanes]|uniref:Tellurite resistance protein n=1 Tax=Catenuloplanes niger TaxID=587534 RepID=A0AAE4D014_9ACTN|nr:hypothetical protein [Catenuloplanes niger]MDR7327464.1 tellurite resistance protein [Catenuloplanes niger]